MALTEIDYVNILKSVESNQGIEYNYSVATKSEFVCRIHFNKDGTEIENFKTITVPSSPGPHLVLYSELFKVMISDKKLRFILGNRGNDTIISEMKFVNKFDVKNCGFSKVSLTPPTLVESSIVGSSEINSKMVAKRTVEVHFVVTDI